MAVFVVVVPPRGEFPINDDWLYTRMVQTLVEHGRLEIPASTAPSLVLQAFWGGLFAKLFGFSHTVLRASTLILAAAGVLGFYALLRQLLDRERALLGALLLLFNPLYVFLAYTFMSDVPFVALVVWSLACSVRALREQSPESSSTGMRAATLQPHYGWLAAGAVLAGAAYLVRQLGLMVPLAVLGGVLLTAGWRAALRPRNVAAILGPFLPAVMIGAYFASQRGPVRQDHLRWTLAVWAEDGAGTIGVIVTRLAETCTTLGLFALPITLAAVVGYSALRLGLRQRALAGALLLLVAAGMAFHAASSDTGLLFPYVRNILSPRGFLVSNNYYDDTLPESIVVSDAALVGVTAAALLGAGLLILAVVAALSRGTLRSPAVLPLLFGLLALGLTVPFHRFLDRYLLAILPFALLVALLSLGRRSEFGDASGRARWGQGLALAGVFVLAIWSIWWERDYFERRAALWQAGELLVAQGIAPEEIDGGFEWNAWYRGMGAIEAAVQQVRNDDVGRRLERRIHERLGGRDARWVLSFAPADHVPTDHVLAMVPYGPGQRVIATQRF